MPFLARLPPGPPPSPPAQVDDRALEFRTPDGADQLSWTGNEYVLTDGIQGLAVPPRELVTTRTPGLEGSRLREIRTVERSVVLPFAVFADDGSYYTHAGQLDRVRGFLDHRTLDYEAAEGTFDLVAVSSLAGERFLRCVYVDGMEAAGADGPGDFSVFDVKLTAVNPYWRGQSWTTPVVRLPAVAPFLSNDPVDGFPRMLAPSVALGSDMPVRVPGRVPSPAVIELTGPQTSAHITSPQGLDVTVGAMSPGQVFILDTGRRRSATLDGVSAWQLIADAPQWRPLPPGTATVSIAVAGATDATSARVYGDSLWETPW